MHTREKPEMSFWYSKFLIFHPYLLSCLKTVKFVCLSVGWMYFHKKVTLTSYQFYEMRYKSSNFVFPFSRNTSNLTCLVFPLGPSYIYIHIYIYLYIYVYIYNFFLPSLSLPPSLPFLDPEIDIGVYSREIGVPVKIFG